MAVYDMTSDNWMVQSLSSLKSLAHVHNGGTRLQDRVRHGIPGEHKQRLVGIFHSAINR